MATAYPDRYKKVCTVRAWQRFKYVWQSIKKKARVALATKKMTSSFELICIEPVARHSDDDGTSSGIMLPLLDNHRRIVIWQIQFIHNFFLLDPNTGRCRVQVLQLKFNEKFWARSEVCKIKLKCVLMTFSELELWSRPIVQAWNANLFPSSVKLFYYKFII